MRALAAVTAGYSLVAMRRLLAVAALVAEHGLSCSVACGIFLDPGSNPCPLRWQADSQPLDHKESPHRHHLEQKEPDTKKMHIKRSQNSLPSCVGAGVQGEWILMGKEWKHNFQGAVHIFYLELGCSHTGTHG